MRYSCRVLVRIRDLAHPRLTWITAALLICAVLANGATIGTSSWLHVNLSFMPFSYYDTAHSAATYGFSQSGIASCPSGASVRGCFQTILGQLRAQAVSGIRIFVTFCDSTSLAFTNCGSPYTQVSWNPSGNPTQQAWITNVANFFQDVHAAGIQNVTITTGASAGVTETLPVSETSSPKGSCPANCCSDTLSTVYFNPLVPFGLYSDGSPLGEYWRTNSNQGYNCAPINNQFFIGWTNYFNVIDAVLAAAKGRVTVYGLEIQEEVNTAAFTALLRYFYDNSMPQSAPAAYVVTINGVQYVNVLSALRAQMSANGFDPGRVEYSAFWNDASTATENCANVYTDYARNVGLDTVTQAINGGPIGLPQGWQIAAGLICGGTTTNMYTSPIYSTQPDVVDVHMYPQVTRAPNTDAMIQQVAALDYGDIPHFLTLASLQSADVVIGETYGGTLSPLNLGTQGNPNYCWLGTYPSPSGAPGDNVAGFNSEGVTNPLSGFTVTFRPWMELEDPSGQCFAYGAGPGTSGNYQSVNYNGHGPYTPTNH